MTGVLAGIEFRAINASDPAGAMRADLRWAQVNTKKGQIPADFRVRKRSDGRAMRADLRPSASNYHIGGWIGQVRAISGHALRPGANSGPIEQQGRS